MYLKSIKAYGFKSFADKTEINFEKNINGIVGPNGSGKSNVVDAVRWVLGEQSLKSLRGDTSTDIIFSGSKSRKALNSASVTLTFDNSDMSLPINFEEVSVKRVMYRTGESEYFLNNEKCRLKDITNLLTDSGADKEAFNIISQGKIDEILSTKPSDRRVIFESAAGILKYKKRKEDAIKKLGRTDNNMDRVNDIIAELSTNLEPLRRQKEDALKYLELKKKLKDIEISLIVYDISNYNNETNSLKERLDILNDELANLSSNSASYDVDILTKKDEIKKIEESISDKQNLFVELTKNIEKINSNMKVLNERKKYNKDDDKVLNNILLLKENILKTENIINNKKVELDSLKENIDSLSNTINNYEKELKNLLSKKNKISNDIDSNNHKLTNLKYRIDYLKDNINNDKSIPNSIRKIMDNPRLKGYHNIIGKLISIPDEYNTCISIALGGSTNYLVIDSSKDARVMVNYLKDNKLGRATFYPLDVIKSKTVDNDTKEKVSKLSGYVGVASDLVSYDDIYRDIMLNRLGNIIVADNIENANNIGKEINNKYRIVTLDGQVVNVGGSITGGSINMGNNIIKEKQELNNSEFEYQDIVSKNKRLDSDLKDVNKNVEECQNLIYQYKQNSFEKRDEYNKINDFIKEHKASLEDLNRELKDLEAINNDNTDKESEMLLNTYYAAINNRDNLASEITNLKNKKDNINDSIIEIEELSKQSNIYIKNKEAEASKIELRLNTIGIKMDQLLMDLNEEYNMTYSAASERYVLDIDSDDARNKVINLKTNIRNINNVNVGAIEEFDRINERYNFLTKQKEDLENAKNTLLEIVDELDSVMKDKFIKTFEEIRQEFKKVFVDMFKGGEAELILTEPDNILETGIEIQAVPTGKKLKSLSLLSGGEKTFTAISLLFAILNVRPVPFCLLDEVEAALDDANVESFGNYLYKYRDKTQFILITHKKKTMEFADVLYGITMQESGVSKLVSVRLDDINE